MMSRALCLAAVTLLSIVIPAFAEPQPADDMAVCRERQSDQKVRLDACDKIIADGSATPRDLASALAVRADAQSAKRDYDKAIAGFSEALKSDPDNVKILEARGVNYERKGQDDLAMADYELVVDKGFSNIEPSAGFMVVYAAEHGETALDGEGVNSPFASARA